MEDLSNPGRRAAMGSLAGGVAAVGLAGAARAQEAAADAAPVTEMRDPQTAFPQPPF